MTRYLLSGLLVGGLVASAQANSAAKLAPSEVTPAVPERFAGASTDEVPDFQRHVVPLFSKLGCSGRSCHGSFQGRGGFRLSLFGYDFKFDHDALLKPVDGQGARANIQKPSESLMLQKPTETVDHEGGLRMKVDSWQYRLLNRWIAAGAPAVAKDAAKMVKLEITPAEQVFFEKGETVQMKVVAIWSDGTREDVTPLTRFKSNDDQVAAISSSGLLTSGQPGDTFVVVFYDNGVVSVPVMRPLSDKVGRNYPKVATPTEIDRLVVQKLRKLGIVPSALSTDAEFLRRVSLDLVGTLPTAPEVEAFLKDTDPQKRAKRVEELLGRPAYAAWWATRLSDFTGNNDDALNNVIPSRNRRASQDWYDWLKDRVARNVPYDKLVEGLVMATSRNSGESFKQFSTTMSGVYRADGDQKFTDREGMSHYWARRTFREPKDRAVGFAYTFLGIRIQCAECHKHPFDQWTKDDFAQFQGFFTGVSFGTNPKTKTEYNEMLAALELGDKKGGQQRRAISEALNSGEVVPFQEVFVKSPRATATKRNTGGKAVKLLKQQIVKLQQRLKDLQVKDPKTAQVTNQITQIKKSITKLKKRQRQLTQSANRRSRGSVASKATLLGGEEVDLTKFTDIRTPLMEWLRRKDNRLFAKAFVNRVWANYFNVGIVEPPDDHSLANPPSNKPLLDYLSTGFVENNYDMKWLHREIVLSRTYQLSWQPNATNRLDERNFSHSIPRRLPAEVAYDAIQQATASDQRGVEMKTELEGRAIALAGSGRRLNSRNGPGYALSVFGRSTRESNCDCDRSNEPSLLQTVFLQNDSDTLKLIASNREGWIGQVTGDLGIKSTRRPTRTLTPEMQKISKQLQGVRRKMTAARKAKNTALVKKLQGQLRILQTDLSKAARNRAVPKSSGEKVADLDATAIINQAYLRTLSRFPNEAELNRSRSYVEGSEDTMQGLRDLLWVLLNTKEFIVNH
jgi:hypothetical protein